MMSLQNTSHVGKSFLSQAYTTNLFWVFNHNFPFCEHVYTFKTQVTVCHATIVFYNKGKTVSRQGMKKTISNLQGSLQPPVCTPHGSLVAA